MTLFICCLWKHDLALFHFFDFLSLLIFYPVAFLENVVQGGKSGATGRLIIRTFSYVMCICLRVCVCLGWGEGGGGEV